MDWGVKVGVEVDREGDGEAGAGSGIFFMETGFFPTGLWNHQLEGCSLSLPPPLSLSLSLSL